MGSSELSFNSAERIFEGWKLDQFSSAPGMNMLSSGRVCLSLVNSFDHKRYLNISSMSKHRLSLFPFIVFPLVHNIEYFHIARQILEVTHVNAMLKRG